MILSVSVYSDDILNYSSGFYNKDIFVQINNEFIGTESIFYTFDTDIEKPDLLYSGGFFLSAITGEERAYNLRILVGEKLYTYNFNIDHKKPILPQTLSSFNEEGSTGIIFSDIGDGEQIYYGYDDHRKGDDSAWNGETIFLPHDGFIYYYSEDAAGNKSEYGILRADKKSDISPSRSIP